MRYATCARNHTVRPGGVTHPQNRSESRGSSVQYVDLVVLSRSMADLRDSGASGGQQLPARLQSADDVRVRRDQVLSKYEGFKEAARKRRERLEAAKQFQKFRRNADELEAWVNEKMQIVSDESHKDRTNLQASGVVEIE